MTYLEWEESKQDQADVKNDSSLGCATISETSSESFSSCYSSDEGSLDNTWDIQERMLAMADRLERGEDIPELGICHSTTEDVQESIPRNCQVPEVVQPNAIEEENKESGLLEVVQSNAVEENKGLLEIVQSNDVEENKEMNPAVNVADALVTEDSISRLLKNAEECVLQDEEVCDMIGVVEEKPLIYALPDDSQLMSSISDYVTRREARLGTPKTNNTSVASYEACSSDDDFDASSVTDVFFQTKTRTPKMPPPPQTTPIKSRNTPIRAAASKTPTRSPAPNKCTPVKNANAKKQALASPKVFRSAAHTVASSPVGMYIMSQPEPMLIENVRKTNTKVIYNNPTSIPRMAVRTSDGRWSMDKRASAKSNTDLKENAAVDDIKPVLPMVLHEAAASQVKKWELHSLYTIHLNLLLFLLSSPFSRWLISPSRLPRSHGRGARSASCCSATQLLPSSSTKGASKCPRTARATSWTSVCCRKLLPASAATSRVSPSVDQCDCRSEESKNLLNAFPKIILSFSSLVALVLLAITLTVHCVDFWIQE